MGLSQQLLQALWVGQLDSVSICCISNLQSCSPCQRKSSKELLKRCQTLQIHESGCRTKANHLCGRSSRAITVSSLKIALMMVHYVAAIFQSLLKIQCAVRKLSDKLLADIEALQWLCTLTASLHNFQASR